MNPSLKPLIVKGKTIRLPIIQGGMGVGVSLYPLARAVAVVGGLGIVSSACLDRVVTKRDNEKLDAYQAAYHEVMLSKANGGFAGMNIMCALGKDYEASVRGALDAKADALMLPVIAAGALFLRHRRLPGEIAPSRTTTVFLWLSAIVITCLMVYYAVLNLQ